ncbi:Het-C-domain-containing protein [Periconia macrospinosa]|uniref:Het-C-domain-containing protein n=1 Tax=Periconia macrospinosa TaxID=97972 RepID=A0A2V1E812_9PLEO|nr:Het-C-domain-containing protein [Periconia macrospinosa]
MAPNLIPSSSIWLPCLILLVLWARPTAAFGAGNIASTSAIEGQRWRHGDIEDTLLTLLISSRTGKKFSKMDVKRVYFGNWLRDYSQAVDVGTVKMVSAEAIRILLWVLGFLSFGYGTKEFEVTRDRLGCYLPEEHIDNPKDYADNIDARQYDRRLRGPVDERRELSVDERTGLKNYIASEDLGITTSAGMVRDLFRRCIDLGRRSGGRGPDFYEALRLLGTATHCLEDYAAHSNFVELSLIEIDERLREDGKPIFPHVGRNAMFRIQNVQQPKYPIVTGTFGGVDFLHSVCGEISDKATQSELQELEGAINDANRKENKSAIKDLLSKLPDGIFGGKDQAGKADELEQNAQAAQMGNMRISPKEPEEFTQQIGELVKQIYPIMEFHDEIMQSITEFIEKVPILPELIEQLQEQVGIFVFSLLAPFVLPILDQVKTELETGSSEVIASSREKQHIVFNDDNSTDPTHSMLSKDHFSNILNGTAGRVASATIAWAVPQIVACWDGEADPEQTIDTIIRGVFHHPAQELDRQDPAARGREIMFNVVDEWWQSQGERQRRELREKLSREGVENGQNHSGEIDHGHGCGKPLGAANNFFGSGSKKGGSNNQFDEVSNQAGKMASEAVGGGALGSVVGGLVGGLGSSLLGGAFGDDEKKSKKSEKHGDDGSYTQSYSESGHHKKKSRDDSERYGQAQYSQTQYSGGGRREDYSRQEQDEQGSYSYQQRTETSSYGGSGGYERREESRYETQSSWQSQERREGYDSHGGHQEEKKKHGKKYGSGNERSGDEDDYKERHHKEKKEKKHKKHGSENEDSGDDDNRRRSGEHKRKSKSPKRRSGEYSHGSGYGSERRQEHESSGYGGGSGYGRQESSGYGGDSYSSGGGGGYGRQESSGYGNDSYSSGGGGYGRQESSGYGGDSYSSGGGYGQERSDYGGRQEQSEYGSSRRDEDEYGERRQQYGGDDGYSRRY